MQGNEEPTRKAQAQKMDNRGLRPLATGLYRDAEGTLYVYIRELLAKHEMPDRPEVREALLSQIREEFGDIKIVVLEDDPPSG